VTGIPPAIRRRQRPEEAFQAVVCRYLEWALAGNSMFFSVPNGGIRSRTEAIRFKATGTIPGIPDLFVINDGRLLGLELKSGKGRLSPTQVACHDRLRAARCPVYICRDLDDVQAALRSAGVPLRAVSITTERIRRGFAAGMGAP
jgi:hypothetical protein